MKTQFNFIFKPRHQIQAKTPTDVYTGVPFWQLCCGNRNLKQRNEASSWGDTVFTSAGLTRVHLSVLLVPLVEIERNN